MDERLHMLEGLCEHALYLDLALAASDRPVAKAEGDDELRDVVLPPLVVSLARLLSARFRREADEGMDEAVDKVASATTAAALAAAVLALNERFRKLSQASAGDVERSTASMYQAAKLQAARELGVKPKLRLPDSRMEEWMAHAYPWWVGDYHSKVLAKQIQAVAQQAIIEGGLSGREAADLVRGQLTRLYGLGRGERSPVAVPRSFHGLPDAYWSGLANHAATTARAFARLSAMEEAGVTTFVFKTAGDERVCAVCSFLDGREFKVADGAAVRERILAAGTPEEYLKVVPWVTRKQAEEIYSRGGDEALAEAGLCVPPLHTLCRCDLYARLS